jgi:hypothetical protein
MGDTDDNIEDADTVHAASYECRECNEMCDIAAKYHNKYMKHDQLIRLTQKERIIATKTSKDRDKRKRV